MCIVNIRSSGVRVRPRVERLGGGMEHIEVPNYNIKVTSLGSVNHPFEVPTCGGGQMEHIDVSNYNIKITSLDSLNHPFEVSTCGGDRWNRQRCRTTTSR